MSANNVKIGPVHYTLSYREPEKGENGELYDGRIDHSQLAIVIDPQMPLQSQRLTLWHELVHAVIKQTGIEFKGAPERIVDALSYALYELLQDNPWLAEDAKPEGVEL